MSHFQERGHCMKATIALLLRQVCSSAEQYGRACMKDWDLSPAQGFVLDHLLAQQGEACATELRRQFGISKSTLSELLNSLRKKGYVEMAQNPADERKKRLVPTPKARRAAPLLHAALERQVAALCRDIPPGSWSGCGPPSARCRRISTKQVKEERL